MATASRTAEKGGKVATLRQWRESLRQVGREGWGDPMGYLFLAPGLILFFVFQIWPLLRGFVMAFTDFAFLKQLTEPAHFVGLSNFIEFFTDDNYFWPSFGRSLTFTAFYLPIMLFLGLFMASAIARVGSGRVAAFFRTSMYLPVILPIAVSALLWGTLLGNQFGYINYILRDVLKLDSLALNWLNDKRATLFVVALMRIWRDAGSSAMLFLIGMYNINEELYESASIDGASGLQKWWSITLPLLRPTIVPRRRTVAVESLRKRYTPPLGQRHIRFHGPLSERSMRGAGYLGLTSDDLNEGLATPGTGSDGSRPPREKGSKIAAACSRATPGPWSRTVSTREPFAALALRWIVEGDVPLAYLAALSTRFPRI